MLNPYLNVNTNYVSMIEALELNANQSYEKNKHNLGEGSAVIRELRTVGIKAARQTGLTSVMRHWAVKHPNEILFVFRDEVNREHLSVQLSTAIPGKVGFFPQFKSLTTREIRDVLSGNEELKLDVTFIEDCRYIFVDDADIVLNRCGFKPRAFNEWVYQTFGSQVLVIHLG